MQRESPRDEEQRPLREYYQMRLWLRDISHHDFSHASLQGLKPDDIGKC